MGQIQETVVSSLNRACDHPDVMFSGCLTGPLKGLKHGALFQVYHEGEVVTCQVRFREKHNPTPILRRGPDVMESALEIELQ